MSFSFQVKSKKTPFQKQKQLEEERKKRDDEEAAKVYEDFIKDFGGDDEPPGSKAFVSGGVIQPGKSGRSGSGGSAHKRHYVPSFKPPGMEPEAKKTEVQEEPVFQLSSATAARGKPRSIDLLLQDLKKDQAERDQRREQGLDAPDERAPASLPEQGSTNLFVGNLAPHIDESMLLREFGRFGPIGSVKIMWPRDDEQRRRGKNTGFVAFMRHEDAEKAKDALDGIMLHDLQLQVGWGKAVPLPAVPVWPPPGGLAAAGGDASGTPVSVAAAPESTRQRMQDGPPPKEQMLGRGPDVEVTIPEDPRQRFVIDAVAYYVMRDGCEFEQVVMERESDNPEFAFMFDVTLPEHAYYRWRIFSLANGDSLRSWRVDPFLMAEGSNRWAPPPMTLVAVAQKSGAQRGERREDAPLPDAQRDRLSDMLRGLTVERAAVRDAMVFALDHADSAADISEILIDALTLAETPGPLKVARLFLLSDILHNTSASVRNASRYRARLQDALPDVFESFQEAYRSAGGRIAQEQLRKNVLKVLRVWRGWYIFSDDFLNGLQATFLRGGSGPAGMRAAASEADGRPVDERVAASLAAMTDDELELKCKHCGLSRRGGREAQIARLLALDAYLNGSKEGGQSTAPDQKPATAPGAAWHEVAGPGCAQPGTASQPSGAINAPGGATEEEQREEVSRAEVAVLDVLGTKGATAEEREGRLVELREGMESGENPPSKRKKTR